MNNNISAIKSVASYVASPVEICCRCGQGIKYVTCVTLADGTQQKYGMDCIHKILAGDNSMKRLFKKNAALLEVRRASLEVLNRAPEEMPRGREYFGSGLYFIGLDSGADIQTKGGWLFHPIVDEKNATHHVEGYRQTPASKARDLRAIEAAKVWLASECVRLEAFLAKYLNGKIAI